MLRFDQFMDYALHDPDNGYYAKKIKTVGKTGDFSTTASLSNSLAKAIAKWIIEEAQHHQLSKVDVLEVGAGSGKLMRDIKKSLPWSFRRRCQFHLVETSQPLKDQQRKLLGKKVRWHDSVKDLLAETNGTALIYSNELVDAFPARIFKKHHELWQELHIDTKQRCEIFKDIENLPESSYFQLSVPHSNRIEVHQSYQQWLDQWIRELKKGSILTIDYGATAENMLAEKPKGTLRAYLKHNLVTGDAVYQSVGHQDITADVNFTDVINWSPQLDTIALVQQQAFLAPAKSEKDHFLSDQEGAGSAFKVLQQRTKS